MIILHNAKIYTLDPDHPTATAIAIDGERIVAVGDGDQLLALREGAETLDVGGRPIIPGLTDAHLHLSNYALGQQKVDCETPTLAECLRRVAGRAQATPPGEWILGHGWNQNDWYPPSTDSPLPLGEGSGVRGGYPTASDLDAIASRHPVFLTAKSLHAAWANTAALQRAGVAAHTPDPPRGRIGRDAHGHPNGILFEAAMQLVYNVLPEPTVEQTAQAIRAVQPVLWQMGLTGVHDYDSHRCFAALQVLHQRGELRLRVVKGIPLDDLPHAVALGLRTGFGDNTLRIGPVKCFSDGALGPRTAAMLQPYDGEPGNRGMLLLDAEELFERGRPAVENGLSLAVHAIGDRANYEVLNGFVRLRDYENRLAASDQYSVFSDQYSGSNRLSKIQNPKPALSEAEGSKIQNSLRHRIEHVQLIHPDDASRLAQLGIIASMQPIHATSDMNMADRYWGERAAFSYAWRTLLDHGTRLAFGSDAPVESPNPLWGLHAAVTRRRLDGSPAPEGWFPAQKLAVMEALQAYTTGAAYAAGMERRLGKLAPGFLADLLVLDTDPFTCEPDRICDIRPVMTMVGGEWVWGC